MKKALCRMIVYISCVSAFCGCEMQPLPLPAYPLDDAAITAALKEAKLPWEITEGDPWPEDHSVYSLHDDEAKITAAISSGMLDGQRALYISFMSHDGKLTRPLSEEEWESVIAFATILYGGFKDKHQVYTRFAADYAAENLAREAHEQKPGNTAGYEEVLWWECTINNTLCRAGIGRSSAGMPQTHLFAISFVPAGGQG